MWTISGKQVKPTVCYTVLCCGSIWRIFDLHCVILFSKQNTLSNKSKAQGLFCQLGFWDVCIVEKFDLDISQGLTLSELSGCTTQWASQQTPSASRYAHTSAWPSAYARAHHTNIYTLYYCVDTMCLSLSRVCNLPVVVIWDAHSHDERHFAAHRCSRIAALQLLRLPSTIHASPSSERAEDSYLPCTGAATFYLITGFTRCHDAHQSFTMLS